MGALGRCTAGLLILVLLGAGCADSGRVVPAGQQLVRGEGYSFLMPALWRTFSPDDQLESLHRRPGPGETVGYFIPDAAVPALVRAGRERPLLLAYDASPTTYGSAMLAVSAPVRSADTRAFLLGYIEDLGRRAALVGKPASDGFRVLSDSDLRVRYVAKLERAEGPLVVAGLEYVIVHPQGVYLLTFTFSAQQANAHVATADAIARSFQLR